MGKKNKIKKITDEQYLAYIAGLKDDPAPAALFDADGKMAVPEAYTRERTEKKRGDWKAFNEYKLAAAECI